MMTIWNEGGPSGQGYSEMEAFLRCPKEYQFGKVRGIRRQTQGNIPDYFAIGSFLHAGRARWLSEACKMDEATWKLIQDDVTKVRCDFELPCSDHAERTALRYIQEYVEHWGVRPLPKIVSVEHLLGPVQLAGDNTERTARLDDFGFYPEFGGKLAIGECKTTAAAISDVANQYTLHGQVELQRMLWELAAQGEASYGAIAGTVLDVVQKGGAKACQFARIPLPLQPYPASWLRGELAAALRAKEKMQWDDEPERRVTSCTRLIGRARVACEFRDLCEFGQAGCNGYVTNDGKPLSAWQPSEGQTTPPWE